jgi:hypothetical protein
MQMQRIGRAVLAGSAGAAALTTLHEGIRKLTPGAPRMDIVAMRGIARLLTRLDMRIPSNRVLHRIALVGDLLSNSAFYAAVGVGRASRAPLRGLVIGALAGLGALVLPRRMGLGDPPHSAEQPNRVMTVGWYAVGGLVAGVVHRFLATRR